MYICKYLHFKISVKPSFSLSEETICDGYSKRWKRYGTLGGFVWVTQACTTCTVIVKLWNFHTVY